MVSEQNVKLIAEEYKKRTGNVNFIGSTESNLEAILPVISDLIKEGKLKLEDSSKKEIISFGGKVSDMFWAKLSGKEIDGYVPSDCGIGGGDYLEMTVDLSTGKIQNWNRDEFIAQFANDESEDE
jgi:hypothetical protein